MKLEQLGDDELIAAGRTNPDAFGVLYDRHAEAVFAYLLRRTRRAQLAAELTAEVFAAAFESSRRFKPRAEPARAWLFAIANHRLSDSWRKQRAEDRARRRLGMRRLEFDDHQLERAEQVADARRAGDELWPLVNDLPPGEREAVLARVVSELSYAELAREFSTTEQALRQRVSRGLARLARLLPERPA
jgi:RNA polymerase sigma factor (sigma-70 family)